MYLDAGHAGWLGWPANLTPAAQMFSQLYRDAGSPAFVRGLATNVANYNALSVLHPFYRLFGLAKRPAPPGASSPDPATTPNPNYDEIHYINVSVVQLSHYTCR